MRFQVPQFIGVEDKIFGPLSFKQFVYLGGAGGVVVVVYFLVENLFVTALFGVPVVALGVALAFFKVNQKPFIYIIEAFFKYIFGSRMYIWKKQEKAVSKPSTSEVVAEKKTAGKYASFSAQRMSNSKLKDLEWSVDISGEKGGSRPL